MNIAELMVRVHKTAAEHGWCDKVRPIPELLCLIHSEVSEALEAYRLKQPVFFTEDGKPEGVAAELADVIIRVLDMCVEYNIPIVEALEAKCVYNDTRPYRHGNKQC